MNDMAFRCEHAIADAGGLARTDLAELNRSLRRNINSARGYCPPIELAAAVTPRGLTVTRPGDIGTGLPQRVRERYGSARGAPVAAQNVSVRIPLQAGYGPPLANRHTERPAPRGSGLPGR